MDDIQEILNIKTGRNPIPRTQIDRWRTSDNIEIQGALYNLVIEPAHFLRIAPAWTFDDLFEFVLAYYARCIRENPRSQWADSRYSAAHDLVNFVRRSWDEPEFELRAKDKLFTWCTQLYREGDHGIRECMITGLLEHLFEDSRIRRLFSKWKEDPELLDAFSAASEWQKRRAGP